MRFWKLYKMTNEDEFYHVQSLFTLHIMVDMIGQWAYELLMIVCMTVISLADYDHVILTKNSRFNESVMFGFH
jgi:tRNA A37 threonylcarbamoyladenosine dehydratase